MLSTTSEPIPKAKVTVIGKSKSGKSPLILTYVDGTFSEPEATVGAPSLVKVASVGERQLRLEICDAAGGEIYQSSLPMYLKGSQGVLICFSVCDRHSFEQVEFYLKLAQKECQNDPYILLIGTKCDTQKDSDLYEKREVGYDEADTFARDHGLCYIETSAKENRNVTEAFELVGKEMLERPGVKFLKKEVLWDIYIGDLI